VSAQPATTVRPGALVAVSAASTGMASAVRAWPTLVSPPVASAAPGAIRTDWAWRLRGLHGKGLR
jgi:hypothetical protein